jgi:hypothetical protein
MFDHLKILKSLKSLKGMCLKGMYLEVMIDLHPFLYIIYIKK